MRPAGWIGLAAMLTAAIFARADTAGNLLRNPGFEELVTGLPAAWKAFVYPAPGAFAKLIEPGHGGAHAAALVIGAPYRREPDNNWSQHIAVPAGTRRLRFAGWIRAEGTGADAFLWLQCWQRRPARLLAEIRTPALSRRDEWIFAEASMDVPAGTDFAMVRLTLRGSGEGWFDDLELIAETSAGSGSPAGASPAPSGTEPPAAAPPSSQTTAATPDTASVAPSTPPAPASETAHAGGNLTPPASSVESSPPIPPKPESEPEPKGAAPAPVAGPAPADPSPPAPGPSDRDTDVIRQTASLEQALTALRQENRQLLDALTALRAQHESVQRDLAAMRKELAALRARTAAQPDNTDRPEDTPDTESDIPIPPLAPRGSAWDDVSVRPPEPGNQPAH